MHTRQNPQAVKMDVEHNIIAPHRGAVGTERVEGAPARSMAIAGRYDWFWPKMYAQQSSLSFLFSQENTSLTSFWKFV